jgi:hypothetical protein
MKFSGPSELTKSGQLKNLSYKGYIRAIKGPKLVMTSSSSSHFTVSYKHKHDEAVFKEGGKMVERNMIEVINK